MAVSVPARDVPDLVNYQAGQGIRALWNGPNTLAESFLNLLYDYQLTGADMGFLSSDPNIGDGKTWRAVRPLGKGGFGMIGLWHAVDASGGIVDEMAIKQANCEQRSDLSANHPGLAKEAVLQHQLNQRNSDDAVHLRRYKYYDAERKYRLYMEFCPHGDLYRLRHRYRDWATLLPELFLWHVFHTLSKAVASMEGPWTNFATGQPYSRVWYMLHMDLKHENVFLCEPAIKVQDGETDPTSDYPGVKVGDFGLAEITGPDDVDRNPTAFWGVGTMDYMPPEQRHFGVHWDNPPNYQQPTTNVNHIPARMARVDKNDPNPARKRAAERAAEVAAWQDGFDFSSLHNVWGIGKIMWDLMTLQEPAELDRELDSLTEAAYNNYPPNEWPRFTGLPAHGHYTDGLRNLVSSCLRVERDWRPAPLELERDTREGLRQAKEVALRSSNNQQPAMNPVNVVYYRRNDINRMPPGSVNIAWHPGEWGRLVNSRFQNRSWEPLVPISAFRRRAEAWGVALTRPVGPVVRPWRVENGVMVFNPGQMVDGEMIFQEAPHQQQPNAQQHQHHQHHQQPVQAPVHVPVQAPIQGPVQGPSQPPPAPPPQEVDYEKLRLQDLTFELRFHRSINPVTVGSTKNALIRRLMAEDALGNRGRGALRLAVPTYKTVKRKWQT